MTNATPVVLFGLKAEIATPVIDGLKPEYEVIHFFDSVAQGQEDLPRLLKGQEPKTASSQGLGSQNYTRAPEAVILGRGFNMDMVAAIRQAAVGHDEEGKPGVPWAVGGLPSTETEKLKTGERQAPPPATYAPQVAMYVKQMFAKVKEQGKWNEDGTWNWAEELNKTEHE